MSTPRMVPMVSQNGDVGDVPEDKVQDAVGQGFEMGVELQTDDGKTGVVPMSKAKDAIASGKFHLSPPKVPAAATTPIQELDLSGKPMTAESATAGLPGMTGNRPVQGRDLVPGAVAGGAAAAAMGGAAVIPAVLPAVLPHTIEGVKALGTWAEKNPVQAYMLYQVMKELIPGAKKAMGIVKGAPEP